MLLFFSYTAAAVITHEGVDGVPYLDKFSVGQKSQVMQVNNLVNIFF